MRAVKLPTNLRVTVAYMFLIVGTFAAQPLDAGLIVNINAGAGLAGNTPALAAFQAAANQWSSRISTNITVNIDADLANLGNPSIIGSTNSVLRSGPYNLVRDAMAAHAAASPDLAILAALPTAAQISATLPSGFTLDTDIVLTQANAKALGFVVTGRMPRLLSTRSLRSLIHRAT